MLAACFDVGRLPHNIKPLLRYELLHQLVHALRSLVWYQPEINGRLRRCGNGVLRFLLDVPRLNTANIQ